MRSLIKAVRAHDAHTGEHSDRVAAITLLIADHLGLHADDRERLVSVARLHDVGKLTIGPSVLNKPGRLDVREWSVVRRHPEEGARLLSRVAHRLGPWVFTVLQHHERWDGRGYPAGLSGNSISLGARIVAVADAYEAMTAGRPYRRFLTALAARDEVLLNAGSQFDPAIVQAFARIPHHVLEREFPTIQR